MVVVAFAGKDVVESAHELSIGDVILELLLVQAKSIVAAVRTYNIVEMVKGKFVHDT